MVSEKHGEVNSREQGPGWPPPRAAMVLRCAHFCSTPPLSSEFLPRSHYALCSDLGYGGIQINATKKSGFSIPIPYTVSTRRYTNSPPRARFRTELIAEGEASARAPRLDYLISRVVH